jgi:hypothetical protein
MQTVLMMFCEAGTHDVQDDSDSDDDGDDCETDDDDYSDIEEDAEYPGFDDDPRALVVVMENVLTGSARTGPAKRKSKTDEAVAVVQDGLRRNKRARG